MPRSNFKEKIEKYGRVVGLESAWLKKDGSKLFVEESAFAARDTNGNTLYYEGTAQDVSQRKEAEDKLMHYQEQLRSLASELSLAEERLRRRIASDLHDNISQNLAISKMKLESLTDSVNPDQAKELLEITNLIAQTIGVTRSLTFEMSPPVLYELGLESAIRWLVNQTRKRFDIDTEFIDDEKEKPVDNDIRVILFQAVRELLANVIKHSKARKVTITASRISAEETQDGPVGQKKKIPDKNSKTIDQIRIIVEDDGVGFDVSNMNEGF
jgi:signal transduction histidine kinase